MRSLIFLLRSERVAATSNYRQKTCLHLHLCLNRIVSGTGRARTEPARQHLSLDDLNGFPSVTKKHPFSISLAFSSTAPRYNGFFFLFSPFLPLPLHSLTPCFLWRSGVSESESASERENRQRLFYCAHLPCLCTVARVLPSFRVIALSACTAAFLMGDPQPALWNTHV